MTHKTFFLPRACAALFALGACASEPRPAAEIGSVSQAVRYCAGTDRVPGIDISRWQEAIDWDAVGDDDQNLGFAIARATRGPDYVDPRFAANWAGMRAQGLVRGAYHFFYPNADAVTQADLLVDTVGTLGEGDLPPTLDIEEVPGMGLPGAATMRAQIRAFIDRVQMRTGRLPMIYTRANFWDPLVTSSAYGDHLLWVADYSHACPNVPAGWDAWNIHQYTDSGSVDGIDGPVDMNYFDGSMADLRLLAGGMSCTPACEGDIVVSGDCQRSDCASFDESCYADGSGARCVSARCPTTGEADVCLDARTRAHCVDGMLSNTSACPRGKNCESEAGDVTCENAPVVVPSDAGIEERPDASLPAVADASAPVVDGSVELPSDDPSCSMTHSTTRAGSKRGFLRLALFAAALIWASKRRFRNGPRP